MKRKAESVDESKVYFVGVGESSSPDELAAAAERLWDHMRLDRIISKDALVAIKQHFGEQGGGNFIPPAVAKAVGQRVRRAGGKPFATDSNTLYNGMRANAVDHLEIARQHGFSHEALGFPLIIADGLKGESQVTLKVKGASLRHVFLAGAGYMADAAIVLTHVTGHLAAGLWDGVCDLWNCSAMFGFAPTANVRQRWLPRERYWHYGGGPGPSAPHINTAKLFLSSYCLGTDGELPYWTFGGMNWRGASRLTAIWTGQNYAASGKNHPGPIAGARLKAIRRGQQDVEYLYLLARQRGWDRARVRRALASYSDDPDAPTLGFGRLSLERWIHLRKALAATIVAAGGR